MDSLAITFVLNKSLDRVITPIAVLQAEDYCSKLGLEVIKFAASALWDTGSTDCCIDAELAEHLGLSDYGTVSVSGSQGVSEAPGYILDILLADGVLIKNVVAAGVHTGGKFDIIIGMNIIKQGDFALTREGDKTVMSFRLPASGNSIDFSKERPA